MNVQVLGEQCKKFGLKIQGGYDGFFFVKGLRTTLPLSAVLHLYHPALVYISSSQLLGALTVQNGNENAISN